jgi:hypothetical protein
MFILPHPLHFAEVMQHHYWNRMALAETVAEYNFCSEAYTHYTNEINRLVC